MARTVKPLTDTQIKNAKPKLKEYNLPDGDGLFLRVKTNGRKNWIYNYRRPQDGNRSNLGLGAYPKVSLSEVRDLANAMRSDLAKGATPKKSRIDLSDKQQLFSHVFAKWFEIKKTQVSANYANDIENSIHTYLLASLGHLSIRKITAVNAIAALQPIANRGAFETVRRLCQRINQIMDFAVNTGLTDTNPLIRINSAFRPPKHKNLPSIPPSQLGDFLGILSKANLRATTRYLILWQLHTITRPVEAAETKWADINFEKHIWTIPAARMKRRRDHSIPLSTSCMNILNSMKPLSRHKEYVFTSERNPNKPTNSQTANMAIKRMGYGGTLVAHGLRSIASTALNEHGFNPNLIEKALSHEDKNTVRAAYNRAEYMNERREMMQWWSDQIERNQTA